MSVAVWLAPFPIGLALFTNGCICSYIGACTLNIKYDHPADYLFLVDGLFNGSPIHNDRQRTHLLKQRANTAYALFARDQEKSHDQQIKIHRDSRGYDDRDLIASVRPVPRA